MNKNLPDRCVDVDVHVSWKNEAVIAERLPVSWRSRWLNGAGHTHAGVRIQPKYYDPDDRISEPVPASRNPAELRTHWLEPRALAAAILSVYDAPGLSTFGDVDYPILLARAINDWLAEEWLEVNPKFFGTIVVATQDPAAAAVEIRRAARHPRMVQVMLPTGARLPYGHRHYLPIYEAAVECGLAIAIHSGTEGVGTSGPPTPCGWPTTLAELRVTRSTLFLSHLTSLITEGVFVRYPDLRVVGLETGIAWLAPYLWRFDKNYKGLRSECPWLKELPSAYVRRFFRFGTQGVESGEPDEFWRLLRSVGADGLLMFSSNYPRRNWEAPAASFGLSSGAPEKRAAIRNGNAISTYSRLNLG